MACRNCGKSKPSGGSRILAAPRRACTACVLKHLSQAVVLLDEARQPEYAIHRWFAVGHLAEAEAEIAGLSSQLAEQIRTLRHELQEDPAAQVDVVAIMRAVLAVEAATASAPVTAAPARPAPSRQVAAPKKKGGGGVGVSLCINAKDEGPRLKATIDNFRAALGELWLEAVVVADGTSDGSADDLGDDVRVIRHQAAVGCGRSKCEALALARGEVVMFSDAHQTLEGDVAGAIRQALAKPRELVTLPLFNIEYDELWQPRRRSQTLFTPNSEAILPGRTDQYRRGAKTGNVGMPSTVVIGARAAWNAVGGWNRYREPLGSQERGLALRAFMAAVPIMLYPEASSGHEFQDKTSASRNRRPYKAVGNGHGNCWHAFYAVAGKAGWRLIEPLLAASTVGDAGPGRKWAAAAEEDRQAFAPLAVRTAAELVTWMDELGQPWGEAMPDLGGAIMEPAALKLVRQHAKGRRVLDLGTGSGSAARAALAGGAREVLTVDHDPQWTAKAAALGLTAITCPLARGCYDLAAVAGPYDLIVVDGPPGTAARRPLIAALIPLLAPGGSILIDDARRDSAMIDAWAAGAGMRRTDFPTHRGMAHLQGGTP